MPRSDRYSLVMWGGVESFPAGISRADVIRRFGAGSRPARTELVKGLIDSTLSIIEPKAVYVEAEVRVPAAGVEIGGTLFSSPGLRHCVSAAGRAFPYILTAGRAVDEAAASSGDAFEQYVIELTASVAVERAVGRLAVILARRLGSPAVSAVSPGCLDSWPPSDLPLLFSLFGGEEAVIGVSLAGDGFMLPKKTVCGVLYPSEKEFSACRICGRRGCLSRSAAHDPAAAAAFMTKIS